MRVDSLPAGAQVFVDGRSVGYTPMIVGALVPGTHSIRMQMPGYRPWVSAVTLKPQIVYGGGQRPAPADEERLHHLAHEQCYIANSIKTQVSVR